MMNSIIIIIISAAAAAFIAWLPYGYAALPFIALFTLILILRRAINKEFRESAKAEKQINFLVVFWIVILFFYIRPSGLEKFIPKMDADNVTVGSLLKTWNKKIPNLDITCRKDISEKRISIHTITPITVNEALSLIETKAGAKTTYSKSRWSRSIAGGPRIRINITRAPDNSGAANDFNRNKPVYEGIQ